MTPPIDLCQLQHFPLERAYLCLDETCRSVCNSPCICPACAGTSLMSLAVVLNRATEKEGAA